MGQSESGQCVERVSPCIDGLFLYIYRFATQSVLTAIFTRSQDKKPCQIMCMHCLKNGMQDIMVAAYLCDAGLAQGFDCFDGFSRGMASANS